MPYLIIGGISVFGIALLVFFIRQSAKNEFQRDQYKELVKDAEEGQKKSAAIDVDTSLKRRLLRQWLRDSNMPNKISKPLP